MSDRLLVHRSNGSLDGFVKAGTERAHLWLKFLVNKLVRRDSSARAGDPTMRNKVCDNTVCHDKHSTIKNMDHFGDLA